jgi:hypothetical protein
MELKFRLDKPAMTTDFTSNRARFLSEYRNDGRRCLAAIGARLHSRFKKGSPATRALGPKPLAKVIDQPITSARMAALLAGSRQIGHANVKAQSSEPPSTCKRTRLPRCFDVAVRIGRPKAASRFAPCWVVDFSPEGSLTRSA